MPHTLKNSPGNCKFLLIAILLPAIFFSSADLHSQAKTGANDTKPGTGSNEKMSVWAVPAEQKVRPEDPAESSNLVWSAEKKLIRVAGARNEHVPFQVVITHPVAPGNKPTPASGFFIRSSDLKSSSGKTIPTNHINFYLEHYIMLYGKSGPVGATGYWPDALAPIKIPFSMAAQYNVVKNRPIWIDLSIDSTIPAGIYKGSIAILQNDKIIETITLEAEVYDFTLPSKSSLVTYMNVSRGSLARFYHKESASPEVDRLTQTYYDFLYSHRMEPWFNDQLQPHVTVSGDKVEVKFNEARYDYYMNKLKSNRVLLEAFPSELERQVKDKPFSKSFNDKVKSYLSQVEAFFKKNGWKKQLVFNSPIDEPNTKEEYEETREWASLVHEGASADVPFLSTESPVTDDPAWGELRGHVNNFSIHGNALNSLEVKKAIREEQAKGGEMTWYISCDQAYPQPNYFIDAPALDPVMVPWITAKYQMSGLLYWAATFWSETPDPWLDPITFISGFLCSDGYLLNGEGSLMYPGDHVKRFTGQPDVDGPVTSMRFELLREGIEDYDYLQMLKDKGDKNFSDSVVNKLVIDVSTFSRNLEEVYAARKSMARRLESKK